MYETVLAHISAAWDMCYNRKTLAQHPVPGVSEREKK